MKTECFRDKFILNNKVLDSSFFKDELLEGTSLYEVIRIIDGQPLFIEKHLERLHNTSRLTGFDIWQTVNEILLTIYKLIDYNEVEIGNIKLIFNYQKSERNFIAYFVKHNYPKSEQYKLGVDTDLFYAERHIPNAKIINKNLRNTTNEFIAKHNLYEVLLVDRNGFITEGSRSNVFMIQDNEIFTSPATDVLQGIARSNVIEICKNRSFDIIERKVHIDEIPDMDGIFLTGTSPQVLPVIRVGDFIYNSESIILHDIMVDFRKLVKTYIENKK